MYVCICVYVYKCACVYEHVNIKLSLWMFLCMRMTRHTCLFMHRLEAICQNALPFSHFFKRTK